MSGKFKLQIHFNHGVIGEGGSDSIHPYTRTYFLDTDR